VGCQRSIFVFFPLYNTLMRFQKLRISRMWEGWTAGILALSNNRPIT